MTQVNEHSQIIPATPARPIADDHEGLPKPRRLWAIAAICFGTSLLVIDGSIANVALPTIARDLGVSEAVVTNVVTVYQLVLVMLLLPFSSLGDRLGHRRLYQAGQVLFMVASALCYLAESLTFLLVLRALQAIGAAMALSVSAAMLRQIYPARQLGTGMGVNSVIVASSAAIAPTLGGYIVGNLPWQTVFVAAAPLAIISLGLGRFLPDPEPRDQPPKWKSGAMSALTMLLLVGGIQLGTHDALAWGVAAFALGVVVLLLLIRRERQREAPVFPVDLLAKPVLGLSALANFASFISAGALMLGLPFRLENGMGYDPQTVGILLLPFPLTMLVVSPLAGWASDRIAATKLGVTGMTIAIIGLLLLATMPEMPGEWGIAWRLSLTALGFGLFFSPNSRLLIGRAPRDRAAAAGGLLSTSRLFGQTMAAVVIGIVLAGGLGLGPVPLYVSCVLAVVAALCSMARFAQRGNPANA
ncbi:MFS transporter [Aurantiacibacter poecillastricola]|uniref:MFS transporter n=1 Tax=Aurantiacibacter poecillastricola TaxID=3064385 RepID=UPI00273F74F7|nr:MFS transporter [Aurantiacibacter sp. 219JJ12-13]MDP5262242.1 MFS transporter [Aurantiacibacter sp. 219JJ12-13]